MCNVNNYVRFKTTMLKPSLCNYSDAYILVKGEITITGEGADDAAKRLEKRDKEVILKNCAPFINCKSEINMTEMYNLIACMIIIQKHLEFYGKIPKLNQMIT